MTRVAEIVLKSVQFEESPKLGMGWDVTFNVRIAPSDFQISVWVSVQECADPTELIKIAYAKLHEVTSALASRGSRPLS